MVSAREDERAQLMLIGAVSLALVILGLVVAYNAAISTENVGNRGSVAAAEDADSYALAAERDTELLFESLLGNGKYVKQSTLNRSIEAYSAQLANSTVGRSSAYIDLELNETSSATVTKVAQSNNTTFDDKNGSDDWTVSESGNITQLEIILTATPSNDKTLLRLENESTGDSWRINIFRDPSNSTIVAETYSNGALQRNCPVPTSEDMEITLTTITGSAPSSPNCSISVGSGVDTPYAIAVNNSNQFEGTYEMFINGSVDDSVTYDNATAGSPYSEAYIRSASIDLFYRTPTMTYETTLPNIRPEDAPASPNASEPSNYIRAINVNGPAVTAADGTYYESDSSGAVCSGQEYDTTQQIPGTSSDELYELGKYSSPIDCSLTVPNGTYDITIQLSENYWDSTGGREFGGSVEGTQYFSGLDLIQRVGTYNAYDKTIRNVTVSGEELNIELPASQDNAVINAIRVTNASGKSGISTQYLETRFEDTLSTTAWKQSGGGEAETTSSWSNRGSQSLKIYNTTTRGGISLNTSYDTSGGDELQIEYVARSCDPNGDCPNANDDENLTIEYKDSAGNWKQINTTNASPTNHVYHKTLNITDAGAFHENFDVRFYVESAQGVDPWLLDDLEIRRVES